MADMFESLLELKGMSESDWTKRYDSERPKGQVSRRWVEIDRILSCVLPAQDGQPAVFRERKQMALDL